MKTTKGLSEMTNEQAISMLSKRVDSNEEDLRNISKRFEDAIVRLHDKLDITNENINELRITIPNDTAKKITECQNRHRFKIPLKVLLPIIFIITVAIASVIVSSVTGKPVSVPFGLVNQ
jgi:hypothetical protein